MPNRVGTNQTRCPMCGVALSDDAEFCAECGERVRERSFLEIKQVLLQRYERNLRVLKWLLITFGHLSVVASIFIMLHIAPFGPAKYAGPILDVGRIAFFAGSAWIVSGYACAYKKRWGILTGLIVSYLTLGASLLYWKLLAIAASLILSIQAHRVLRFSHQVIAESLGQEKDA